MTADLEHHDPKRDGRFKRRRPTLPDWRRYATPQEAADLASLEENALRLEARRRKLSIALGAIRTRCMARRKYGLAKGHASPEASS